MKPSVGRTESSHKTWHKKALRETSYVYKASKLNAWLPPNTNKDGNNELKDALIVHIVHTYDISIVLEAMAIQEAYTRSLGLLIRFETFYNRVQYIY